MSGRFRDAVSRLIDRAASDDQPRWVRSMKAWSPPTWYCAFVALVGIWTLLLRPFLPHATGTTYGPLHTVRECWPLAGVFLGFLATAIWGREFGAFLFICVTAMIRCTDALHPLSVGPFLLYGWLVSWKFCVFVGWSPVPWLAGRWRGRHAARP